MRKLSIEFVAWVAAIAVLTVGASLMAKALAERPRLRSRLVDKHAMLERLQTLKHDAAPYRAAQAAYTSAWASSKALSVTAEALLRRTNIDLSAADVRSTRENIAPGWVRIRESMVFKKADLTALMSFLHVCETQIPPWRLASLDLRAEDRDGGRATATVALERLQPANVAPSTPYSEPPRPVNNL